MIAMRKTPLYEWHSTHGGRIVDFAGWAMPVQYSSIIEEHQTVRKGAGLFDISHMGRLRLTGDDAVSLSERLVTCRVSTTKIGQVRYGLMTNEQGGILDDVLVYRLGEAELLLVVNASNREKIVRWIESYLGDFDAVLRDDTFETAMIALQGPASAEMLASRLTDLRYYQCLGDSILKVSALVSRTGYTGEDGFEFIVSAADAEEVWQGLIAAGKHVGLVPCGLGCRDTLRLEAAMPLYGHELSEEIDPVTAGLSFAVALDKDFIGRDAVAKIAAEGPKRTRVGLRFAGKRIAREGTPLLVGEEPIGVVTSGSFSPTLQAIIAMGYVPCEVAEPGTPLGVDLRGKRESATIVGLPFYKRA